MAIYYVDQTGGNDGWAGTFAAPWKTVAKVNGFALVAGDIVFFKRGEVWREKLVVPENGAAGNPITFGAYGSGAKPKILGSTDLALVAWNNEGGNIWYASGITTQIGIVVFNNEGSTGVKMAAKVGCVAQGDFWWDDPNDRLYMYSVGTPAAFYTNIEAGTSGNTVSIGYRSHIIIQDLDVRYSGTHGIAIDGWDHAPHDIIIQYNSVSYCGGGNAQGNGVQIFSGIVDDCIIRYNKFNQIYDSGIAIQDGQPSTFTNVSCYYNLISNCEHGIEVGAFDAATTINGVYIYNNTVYNSGGGFSHSWRADPYGDGIIYWGMFAGAGLYTDVNIKNNLISNCIYNVLTDVPTRAGVTVDYNLYYTDGLKFGYADWPPHSAPENFADWKTNSGQDAHSVITNPLLVSATDYHLQAGSGAYNAGINVGLAMDYDKSAVGDPPDIGAYEYTNPRATINRPRMNRKGFVPFRTYNKGYHYHGN